MIDDTRTEFCQDCRFFIKERGKPMGECRRNPPRFKMVDRDPLGVWPYVSAEDWCGRYEANAETIAEALAAQKAVER